jgi:hypothetical protein
MMRTAHSTKGEHAMGEMRGKQWVDFRELKASISFEQVLERLGVLTSLTRVGDELQGPCPICQGDKEKSRSFNVNMARQIFQCFACKRRGNMLDFTAAIRHTDAHGAALWLRDEFLHKSDPQSRGASLPGEPSTAEPATPADTPAEPCPGVLPTAKRDALTDREWWLLDLMAQATAFVLAQRFRLITDVEPLHKDIMQMIEVHSGIEAGIK